MGCGQSKIHLYPRKSKSKANGKKSGHIDIDGEADEEDGHINEDEKEVDKDTEKQSNQDEDGSMLGENDHDPGENYTGDLSVSLLRTKNLSLLQSQEISSSQQNFFRMLDQKIDEGPDYDSASETEIALEEARLNALVQHWESASMTASLCSSASRSLQTTPIRQAPMRQPQPLRAQIQQPLSAELLSQQQLKQAAAAASTVTSSPKRGGGVVTSGAVVIGNVSSGGNGGGNNVSGSINVPAGDTRHLLSQSIIHQSYGVSQANAQNMARHRGILSPHISLNYYAQPMTPPIGSRELIHPMQLPQTSQEPRFPPSISVQRLPAQLQRQIRETQEFIKDTTLQLYAGGYGSPGPPMRVQSMQSSQQPSLQQQQQQQHQMFYNPQMVQTPGPTLGTFQQQQQQQQPPPPPTRTTPRRSTLEGPYSQELS